jgi:nitrate reductase beta subunit
MAIADYEDRFVIPVSHREYAFDVFGDKAECGFSDGEGCGSMEIRLKNLFGGM